MYIITRWGVRPYYPVSHILVTGVVDPDRDFPEIRYAGFLGQVAECDIPTVTL